MNASRPFLLSDKGSTRATAYQMANKVVTCEGKTHVVWLDAVSRVCSRTFDHATQAWGPKTGLFEGCDNHANPALTIGADRRLRLVYGPHGYWGEWNQARFKWVLSAKPNDSGTWQDETSFGYAATYASLIHIPPGLDVIVYRGGEDPWSLMFQKQRARGGWCSARELMRQEIPPQYTSYGATVACDGRGNLYVAGCFYNDVTDKRSAGVAVLKSTDQGESWIDLSGRPVRVPILYESRFAVPAGIGGTLDGLAVDDAGVVWVATSGGLSRWTGDRWETVDLAPFVPADRIAESGPITLDAAGRLHMATAMRRVGSTGESWGHPSYEVFHLVSADGGRTFACRQVSETDESRANWLPSLSLAGPFHPVDNPVILYTHGEPGAGCRPATETEVFGVRVSGS